MTPPRTSRQFALRAPARQHGYLVVFAPEHPTAHASGRIYEHVLLAERVLGRALPRGAQVHHVNGDGYDNSPQNLVVCQDTAYHHLLHYRQRALDGCGNANWHRCNVCRAWDDPANMRNVSTRPLQWYHRACANRATREGKRRRAAQRAYVEDKF